MTFLVSTIFFASGVAALLFETLWFHQAGLAFGNSVWASSLVLSGFMGGLALGNAFAARYGPRFKRPMRVYALIEVVIAVTGVGLVYVLPALGTTLASWFGPLMEHPWIMNLLRLLVAFVLLLMPSTAMGATLPLLAKTLANDEPNFGYALGNLYGWNTLGAVGGVIAGETFLIGSRGVRGTALAAGAVNLLAAGAALRVSARLPASSSARGGSSGRGGESLPRRWLFAAFLSGFCLLALEVVWFRLLLLFVIGHSLAFALMLATVLAGIALGALAASRWLKSFRDAYHFASATAFGAGFLCAISYGGFPIVLKLFTNEAPAISQAFGILRVAAPLIFPVSFFSGIFFTLAGTALRKNLASETAAGVLTLANTAGAAAGSLLASFVFLPVLGMERSILLITLLYGGIGALVLPKEAEWRRITYCTAVMFVASALAFPVGSMRKNILQLPIAAYLEVHPDSKAAAVREGLTETIVYFESLLLGRPVSFALFTNSHPMSATKHWASRYMKLFVYWPMAVHPDMKRALLICYGVGNTAKAMTDSKSLESIDVVDISRDVLEMNSIVYPDAADRPLRDPRVHVHIEDGRYFLQLTRQRFDLITGEPPPPQNAGVGNLYSREYFQLLFDRLAEGGIVTYWLPLHSLSDAGAKSVLRGFCDVFEDCSLWNGSGKDLMMVGTRSARGPVSEGQFVRQWHDPVVAEEMKRLEFERPEQLGALFIGDAGYLKALTADSPALVDDYPQRIEAPIESPDAARLMLERFSDAAAAREQFLGSPLIKRLWPEGLRKKTAPYFAFQDVVDAQFYGAAPPRAPRIAGVHALLTRSSLTTPVLWLLGSNWRIQRILADAAPRERASPFAQLHFGIRQIAERRYALALPFLARAQQDQDTREEAFRLRIYALCMLGRTSRAQRLVRAATAPDLAGPPSFWPWMKTEFGINLPDA